MSDRDNDLRKISQRRDTPEIDIASLRIVVDGIRERRDAMPRDEYRTLATIIERCADAISVHRGTVRELQATLEVRSPADGALEGLIRDVVAFIRTKCGYELHDTDAVAFARSLIESIVHAELKNREASIEHIHSQIEALQKQIGAYARA